MSATDPPPIEPSEDPDRPRAAPQSTDNEPDAVSPGEKRKMKDALDDFLEPD